MSVWVTSWNLSVIYSLNFVFYLSSFTLNLNFSCVSLSLSGFSLNLSRWREWLITNEIMRILKIVIPIILNLHSCHREVCQTSHCGFHLQMHLQPEPWCILISSFLKDPKLTSSKFLLNLFVCDVTTINQALKNMNDPDIKFSVSTDGINQQLFILYFISHAGIDGSKNKIILIPINYLFLP